ncbi:MAG TPA: hypothetical protein VIE43_21825 [Thermoanaerobaculia bacterium]|nr:hypothetical protein [Thermoanaerobaculia bacterium]
MVEMAGVEHAIDLDLPPAAALAALRQTAEDLGAELQAEGYGWKLHIPVLAGLRRGLVSGPVEILPTREGSRLVFRPESTVYHVQTQAVMILLLATAGGLLTLVWPFFPRLLSIAPFGALVALGGWFLVISRLRTSGPDEFLMAVTAHEGGVGRDDLSPNPPGNALPPA